MIKYLSFYTSNNSSHKLYNNVFKVHPCFCMYQNIFKLNSVLSMSFISRLLLSFTLYNDAMNMSVRNNFLRPCFSVLFICTQKWIAGSYGSSSVFNFFQKLLYFSRNSYSILISFGYGFWFSP